jgi:hypothetical protein
MPRRKTSTPTAEPSPSRTVVAHPPSKWLALLKTELVSAGVAHDHAGLIARRVVCALVPLGARMEALDETRESAWQR